MTLGIKNCRKGFNVCINYKFILLQNDGVVAKRLRAAAAEETAAAADEGDDNTPSFYRSVLQLNPGFWDKYIYSDYQPISGDIQSIN